MWLLFLCLGTAVSSIAAYNCVLSAHDIGFLSPFVLSTDGNFSHTNGFDESSLRITIPANEEVILSCAPSYFDKERSSKTKTAKCVDGSLEVDPVYLKGCKRTAVLEFLKPIPGCRENATAIEFGYENPIKQETVVIGEACYDETEGRTIFAHTKLVNNGNSKTAALETLKRLDYLTEEEHPDFWYKAKFFSAASYGSVHDRLQELLSTETVPLLTYRSLVNLQMLQHPQLHSAVDSGWNLAISNGAAELSNYDLLLKDIMTLNDTSVDMYFGTHSIFSVQTENKGAVDIYLYPDVKKYPVPKYLWAVVKTDSRKAAAFLVSNDIDSTVEELVASQLCDSKCTQMAWLTNLLKENAYQKPENGFVTCCDLNTFKSKVSELPPIEGEYDLLK